MKELFITAITQPPEVLLSEYICLSLCLFLSSSFHAVKSIQLEPT